MSTEDLDVYKDYTYIMYIICDKTASFYSKIKNVINIPIVICSTCLSIVNTTELDQDLQKILMVRYVSIGFNLLIALSIAILNLYKITEKEYAFKSQAMCFLKLYNKLDAESTKSKTLMTEIDILSIVNEYNLLCEYITFHIPSHIRRQIEKKYAGCKFPFLLINTKQRKPSLQVQQLDTKPKAAPPPREQPAAASSPTSSTTNINIEEFLENYFINQDDNNNFDKRPVWPEQNAILERTEKAKFKPAAILNRPDRNARDSVSMYDGSPFSVLAESVRYSPLYAIKEPIKSFKIKRIKDATPTKFSNSTNNI
jgi:hypothetical protein